MAEARNVLALSTGFKTGVGLAVDADGLHVRTSFTVPPPAQLLRSATRRLRSVYNQLAYLSYPLGTPAGRAATLVSALAGGAWLQELELRHLRLGLAPHAWLAPVLAARLGAARWACAGPADSAQRLPWPPGLGGASCAIAAEALFLGAAAAAATLVLVLAVASLSRLALLALLRDRAFLHQPPPAPGGSLLGAARPRASLYMRGWLALVRALTRGRPLLFSFQGALPALPLPRLEDTVERYVASRRVLQTADEALATAALARAFLAAEGPALQRRLGIKRFLERNYVTEWWQRFVYLRGRSPIAVSSNFYALDGGRWAPKVEQAARAAVMIAGMLKYKDAIETETLEPILVGGGGDGGGSSGSSKAPSGGVPLCMAQVKKLFATSRIPGREEDRLRHWDAGAIRHVSVACAGTLYALVVVSDEGSARPADEIEDALADIMADAAARALHTAHSLASAAAAGGASAAGFPRGPRGVLREAEALIPALTAMPRTRWAEVRETHFSEGANRRSLNLIEKGLFHVVLSDECPQQLDWTARARAVMCGDRVRPGIMFDKSITLVVHSNAHFGLNVEHSFADAPITGQLLEHLLIGELNGAPYDDEGHVKSRIPGRARGAARALGDGSPVRKRSSHSPEPAAKAAAVTAAQRTGRWQRLQWALTPEAEECVLLAADSLRALADNLDLCVTPFSAYGKGFVKSCGVSPDAYIQLALQLAYFRDQGRFDATYEAAMTRLFLQGRTETVRPCTAQSCEFVMLMCENDAAAAVGSGSGSGPGPGPGSAASAAAAAAAAGSGSSASGSIGGFSSPTAAWEAARAKSAAVAATAVVAGPREKLAALRRACQVHVDSYVAAMEGRGIDRHLFALFCVAVGTSTESPFLKDAVSLPWKLSTSQVPPQQTALWRIGDKKYAKAVSAGGGFAPVADDGYGVSYLINGENEVVFHVSAMRKGFPRTSAKRFTDAIVRALADMREVLTEALKLEQRERLPPLPSSRVSEESAGGNLSSPASALTTPTPLMLPA
jgi:hypothetical protein